MTKYIATATVVFDVEFDDDEDMSLDSQAYDAAMNQMSISPWNIDCETSDIRPAEDARKSA